MTYPTHLLPTTVVGSYPQPAWLVDGDVLKQHGVPKEMPTGYGGCRRPCWSKPRMTAPYWRFAKWSELGST